MVGKVTGSASSDDVGDNAQKLRELSIERAWNEFNTSVKYTLTKIIHQIDDSLVKNYQHLEELGEKIAARTNFLEKNPSFLSCLIYNSCNIKFDPVTEFDEILITFKEHKRRYDEKVREIEKYHDSFFKIVVKNAKDNKKIDTDASKDQKIETNTSGDGPEKRSEKLPDIPEDVFEDCLETQLPSEVPQPNLNPEDQDKISKCSFERVIITKHAYSDISLSGKVLEEIPKLFPDDLPVEVERRKPIEDIHDRLVKQLEASDSLEGFLKLMDRQPSKQRTCKHKNHPLEEKYSGSLWFFPGKGNKRKSCNSIPASVSRSQRSARIEKSSRHDDFSGGSRASTSTCTNLLISNSVTASLTANLNKKATDQPSRATLKYYDLLDDLECKDLKPIKSEYPRRDDVQTKPFDSRSYLHRMMGENERVWQTLLQPRPKLRPQDVKVVASKEMKRLVAYLTSPTQKFLDQRPKSLIVMPVKVIYDNIPTKEVKPSTHLMTDLTKLNDRGQKGTKSSNAATPRVYHVSPTPPRLGSPPRTKPIIEKTPRYHQVPSKDSERRKEMLAQLKGLKSKNDHIQKNIQKAIEVIESKMIDLLSSPTESGNTEAFNAMELEITKVLQMMDDCEKGEKHEQKDTNTTPTTKRVRSPKQHDFKTKLKRLNDEEVKKMADIEDGERLLGQVDNVIKKIDGMYNKFNEDGNKTPKMTEESFSSVLEFFDGLQDIMEPPTKEETVVDDTVEHKFQLAHSYSQVEVYHQARLVYQSGEDVYGMGDCIREEDANEDPKEEGDVTKNRHAAALKAFYALFFATVFIALNYDYVA